MIKRTAQEWADFTGCDFINNGEELFVDQYTSQLPSIAIDRNDVIGFENIAYDEVISPSEPCTLVPDRELVEMGNIVKRMETAISNIAKQGMYYES